MDLQAVKTRARDAAQNLRRQLKIGTPANPVRAAEQLGIRVVEGDLPPGTWGGILVQEGQTPVIMVEASAHKNRQKFTVAHELGHYVDHTSKEEKPKTYVDRRDKEASMGSDPAEVFANQFAAEFLMPAEEVEELKKEKLSVGEMAQHFGVSDLAMGIRLRTYESRERA